VIAQAMVEYGLLQSVAAGFVATRNKVETLIGAGNSKYLLCAALAIVIMLLVKRSRARY
jgi:hypothetical protein